MTVSMAWMTPSLVRMSSSVTRAWPLLVLTTTLSLYMSSSLSLSSSFISSCIIMLMSNGPKAKPTHDPELKLGLWWIFSIVTWRCRRGSSGSWWCPPGRRRGWCPQPGSSPPAPGQRGEAKLVIYSLKTEFFFKSIRDGATSLSIVERSKLMFKHLGVLKYINEVMIINDHRKNWILSNQMITDIFQNEFSASDGWFVVV